jgi:hypothetical protein
MVLGISLLRDVGFLGQTATPHPLDLHSPRVVDLGIKRRDEGEGDRRSTDS